MRWKDRSPLQVPQSSGRCHSRAHHLSMLTPSLGFETKLVSSAIRVRWMPCVGTSRILVVSTLSPRSAVCLLRESSSPGSEIRLTDRSFLVIGIPMQ
jgi:hypothetical protein